MKSSFLSHCVRGDGERLDPSLSPAPSLLAEDGRGVLYALGTDGVVRAAAARHVNADARRRPDPSAPGTDADVDTDADAEGWGGPSAMTAPTRVFTPTPSIDFEPRTISVSPSGHFAALGGLRHGAGPAPAPPSSALTLVSLRSPAAGIGGVGGGGGGSGWGDGAGGEAGAAAAAPGNSSRRDSNGGRSGDSGGGSGGHGSDSDGEPGSRAVPLLEEEFARHPSVRVLRASWHPNSDGHLVVLLSDGTLHVFDAASGEARRTAPSTKP